MRRSVVWVLLLAVFLTSAGCGESVASLRESGHVAGLVAIAQDATLDYTKRADAFDAPGDLGTSEAVDALLGMLQDPETASDAARALGAAGDPRAIDPLISYLDSLEPTAEDYVTDQLRGMELATATRALGGIEDPRALDALLEHLDAGHAASISVEALAGQGGAAVTELKTRLAEDKPNI